MKTLRDLLLTHIPCGAQYTDEEWTARTVQHLNKHPRTGSETLHVHVDNLAGLWLQSGCPAVIVGHKLAASLACTSAAGLEPEDFVLPWRCFYIHCPTDLFPTIQGPVTGLLFVNHEDSPGCSLIFDEGSVVGSHDGETFRLPSYASTYAKSLAELARDFEPNYHPDDTQKFDLAGANLVGSLRRLAVGVILELGTPRFREQIALGPPRRRPSKRRSDVPLNWNIKLTRDVVIDVRQGLRSYCLGTRGTSPTIQIVVRGHRRRQACGPGGTERKIITIDPYYRGPEDAPIGVRSHIL